MTSPARSSHYCAYLLRCWQGTSQPATGAHAWHFSLEEPSTGARHSFASFDALIAFLQITMMADQGGSSDARVDEQIG